MKRNFILIIVLFTLLAALTFGTFFLNNPELFASSEKESDERYTEIVRYHLSYGSIIYTLERKGQVISQKSDLYEENITVEYTKQDTFSMKKSKGDVISSSDVLWELNGKADSIGFNGQVLEIEYLKGEENCATVIRLLNYDKLFIVISLTEEEITSVNYGTEVSVLIDGKNYQSYIVDIGSEIIGGLVEVAVDLPVNARPGASATVTLIIGQTENGLFLPAEAFSFDGENCYVEVLTDEGKEMREVKLGQYFTLENDGNSIGYYEIVSGLTENDVVIKETISYDFSKIGDSK